MGICCCASRPADEFRRSKDEPASLYPSSMSLSSSTPNMKGFRELTVAKAYSEGKKILVLGTSEHLLPCANGTFFNTGHNATELFVPLYHLHKCGFTFDIATEEGKELATEKWTFQLATGYEDKLREMEDKLKDQITTPMKYDDVDLSLANYAAVFIPGGHGPLIKMPTMESLGKILKSANGQGLPTISLCHGPVALATAALAGDFCYKGYKICVFPDSMDKSSPNFGYLPGQLDPKYQAEAKLKGLGCQVVNTVMDDSTYTDRELVTGASQLAAQKTAEAAIKMLSAKYGFEAA